MIVPRATSGVGGGVMSDSAQTREELTVDS